MKQPTPEWLNGKPFYCAVCGAGFGEFMACEMPDCKLETEAEARARQYRAVLDAARKSFSEVSDG